MGNNSQEPWVLSREDLDMVLEVVSARADQLRATVEFERKYRIPSSERLAAADVDPWTQLEQRLVEARDTDPRRRLAPEPARRVLDITAEPQGGVIIHDDAGGQRVDYDLAVAAVDSPTRPTLDGYRRLIDEVADFAHELQERGTTEAVLQARQLRANAVNLQSAARQEPVSPEERDTREELTEEVANELYDVLRSISVDLDDHPSPTAPVESDPTIVDPEPGRSID